MRLVIRAPKDFWSGILFMGLGASFLIMSLDMDMFSRSGRIGPGLFPGIIAGLLVLVGLIVAGRALLPTTPEDTTEGESPFAWRPLALILGGVVLFGLIVRPAGMLVALPLLILIASWASGKATVKVSVISAVGLTIFCWLVFSVGLGLPIPLAPWLF